MRGGTKRDEGWGKRISKEGTVVEEKKLIK